MNGGVHNEAFLMAILLILVLVLPALSATGAGSVTSPEKGNTDANVTPDKEHLSADR